MTDDSHDRPTSGGTATGLIHHGYEPPGGFEAMQPAVHKASTVIFRNVEALRSRDWKEKSGYTYGLHGTPTTFTLEARIATLEGGTDALLVPSGLAAITLVDAACLSAGDVVLLPDNVYGPSREVARHELARWGIAHAWYDPMDPASLAAALSPKTRLVWIEVPGSVTMEFPDIVALVGVVRGAASNPPPTVALDNTWGAGLAFDPFHFGAADLGVDISVQALTKYPSGGGDVLMGSVTTRDAALHQTLKATHMRMGWGVGADDVAAVLRSLPSLPLRYAAQDRSARTLAQWFAGRSEVSAVLHPAFADSPGHRHWAALCSQAAGLFSVVFRDDIPRAKVDAFVDALRLFRIGYSWAGPISLAVPYDLASMREKPAWSGGLVRFSVGLEDTADLVADCAHALAVAFGPA